MEDSVGAILSIPVAGVPVVLPLFFIPPSRSPKPFDAKFTVLSSNVVVGTLGSSERMR